jgi:hypothetical protein
MQIKLMPEYGCSPAWQVGAGPARNIPIRDLAITQELREALERWDDRFQSTFNTSYPPDSGFRERSLSDAFLDEGEALASRLREELGPVEYGRAAV